MTSLEFVEGTIPDQLMIGLDLDLFYQPQHLKLQSPVGWVSFYLTDRQSGKLQALVHFHVAKEEARSPLKSPYGSFWFREGIPFMALFEFIQSCEKALSEKGVRSIQIKNPPALYQPQNAALLQVMLHNLNYQVMHAEVSSVIEIKQEGFLGGVKEWELRKYHMARKKGLTAQSLPADQLNKVYTFIADSRKLQARQLSLSWEEMMELAERFPDRIFLFAVMDQRNQMVASSINIQVNKKIIYHFYGAHDPAYNKVSPVVMMMENIYAHCQRTEIEYLDLGASSSEGKPNFTLLDFKNNLGAVSSEKLTFQKTF